MSREKVGRNDPCPCGSGQKYKRCCLGVRQPPAGVWRGTSLAQPNHIAAGSNLERLLADVQASRHESLPSLETTLALAFLEADLALAVLKQKPAVASDARRKKWSLLVHDRPFLLWESALPHVLRTFEREGDRTREAQPVPRIRFGLEIGRVRDLRGADESPLPARELQRAFENACITRPCFRTSMPALERFRGVMSGSYHSGADTTHIYEAVIRTHNRSIAIPLHGLWKIPASQDKNFALFESLVVTIGEGARTVAVSLEAGRLFYPGTLQFLEAFSPFCEKSGLVSWSAIGDDVCARRAEMLHGLLCDPFFIHVFLRYSHERGDAGRQAILGSLAGQVCRRHFASGERATMASFARSIPVVCIGSPWFRAFADGVGTDNEAGQALRDAFEPIWNAAVKNASLKGYPTANAIYTALGAPKPKLSAKKPRGKSYVPGTRRLGLWRVRRGEASAASLSQSKLLTAVAQLNAEGRKILSERGLPLSLLPTISFLQEKGAPEAQYSASSRALLLIPKVLERPWKHIRDVIVWALAQALAAHYEEQRSIGKALQSDSAGESPWVLACRRLCLRAELQAHQGRMDSVPSEAWLGRENLDDDERRFLEKVDKLLNLTTSANEHEAALAMERAQQLLGRRRVELRGKETGGSGSTQNEPPYVSLTLSLGTKKIETVTGAIGSLLMEHYAVSAMWGWEFDPAEDCESSMTLTLVGRKENVLLAEHVFDFLCQQADSLWQHARKEKGFEARMRVSFQYGLIEGFRSKLAKARRERQASDLSAASENALVRLDEADLAAHMRDLFPEQTKKTASTFKVHEEGLAAGKAEGKRLSIHAPVTSSERESNSPRMLGG